MKAGPGSEPLDGSGLRVGVVAARWNGEVTDRLLEGALARAAELSIEEVEVVRVPGALEIPIAAQRLAEGGCDAVVAIGVVIKGGTDHYDIVVRESARGLTIAALGTGVPITNAILAVHEFEQAVERAGEGEENKGNEAMTAAVELVRALEAIG